MLEKDTAKLKEIAKAYKGNMSNLEEIREKYKYIKRMENGSKKDKSLIN
jgi:hypothetical protein